MTFINIFSLYFRENKTLGRGFTWKIKPYFLGKIKVKIKMSSAAIFIWCFRVKYWPAELGVSGLIPARVLLHIAFQNSLPLA